MQAIKGKWLFNETLDLTSLPYFADKIAVNFTSNNIPFSSIYKRNSMDGVAQILMYWDDEAYDIYANNDDMDASKGWTNQAYRTVDFGSTEQTVSDEFLTWMTANATQDQPAGVTIAYKDTIISIKDGQTVTLHTTDKKLTEDLEIIAPESTVEDWDGTIVVEGGTISFTIAGVSYEAEDGMTWGEWVESEYNPDYDYAPNFKKFYSTGDTVYQNETGSGTPIDNAKPDSEIIEGYDYTLKAPPTSGGGSN